MQRFNKEITINQPQNIASIELVTGTLSIEPFTARRNDEAVTRSIEPFTARRNDEAGTRSIEP